MLPPPSDEEGVGGFAAIGWVVGVGGDDDDDDDDELPTLVPSPDVGEETGAEEKEEESGLDTGGAVAESEVLEVYVLFQL